MTYYRFIINVSDSDYIAMEEGKLVNIYENNIKKYFKNNPISKSNLNFVQKKLKPLPRIASTEYYENIL